MTEVFCDEPVQVRVFGRWVDARLRMVTQDSAGRVTIHTTVGTFDYRGEGLRRI